MALIKTDLKFISKATGKHLTLRVSGRTTEELNGRVEKTLMKYYSYGWTLR